MLDNEIIKIPKQDFQIINLKDKENTNTNKNIAIKILEMYLKQHSEYKLYNKTELVEHYLEILNKLNKGDE